MTRDIKIVIERVRAFRPDAIVEQFKIKWPADDDGLWFFGLAGVRKDIQVESSTGATPFLIEHEDMRGLGERIREASVDQAVGAISAYLSTLRRASQPA